MLPHLAGRPIVITRYPKGIHGDFFYQKNLPEARLTYQQGKIAYPLVETVEDLAYLVNLGAIELHPWLSRVERIDEPTYTVIDLDPSEGVAFADVTLLAQLVKQILDTLGLTAFLKGSGATGLHIYVPLAPGHSYEESQAFVRAIGELLLRAYPQKVTLERVVAKRGAKVYIDYLQNRKGQTIIAVYGVRPRAGAPVSAPLLWQEVGAPPTFSIKTLPQRLRQWGDLFAPLLRLEQRLGPALKRLQAGL